MTRGLLALALLGGCMKVEPVAWEPLDVETLEQDLEQPSAALTDAALADVLASPVSDLSLVEALLGLARLPIEEVEGAMAPTDLGVDLGGTQLYLRVACPGTETAAPDPEFRYGSITIYSPLLSKEVLDDVSIRGDLYAVARGCTMGTAETDGAMRMHYDDVEDRLAVAFDVDVVVDGMAYELDAVVLDEGDARTRVLYTDEAGETLTIDQDAMQPVTTYTVRGRDRALECDGTACVPR